jgi:TatD DNase family protein
MIDTHCHLTFDAFDDQHDAVLARAHDAGVQALITVSCTAEDARRAQAVAERYDNVWCTAGMHPLYAGEPRDWTALAQCAAHPKCVAWGELGLDNHYADPPADLQRAVLEEHLAAIESAHLDKPVVIHCREAHEELIAILRRADIAPERFVFHCFNAGPEQARMILDFGAFISFTGIVTFKNARPTADAAKLVPDDRIMVETDAPFLAPEPHRKQWPNEPALVVHTARFIADLRGADHDAFETLTDENAQRFYNLTLPA